MSTQNKSIQKTCSVCKTRFRTTNARRTKCDCCSATKAKSAVKGKKCIRCGESRVTFEKGRRICIECSTTSSSFMRSIHNVVRRYHTTNCFPEVSDIANWIKLVRERSSFGSRFYTEDAEGNKAETFYVPADLHIAHRRPFSRGGDMSSGNLFLWTAEENRRYSDSNKDLYEERTFRPTLKDKFTIADMNKEFVGRFGKEWALEAATIALGSIDKAKAYLRKAASNVSWKDALIKRYNHLGFVDIKPEAAVRLLMNDPEVHTDNLVHGEHLIPTLLLRIAQALSVSLSVDSLTTEELTDVIHRNKIMEYVA